MRELAAERKVPVVIMHMLGDPTTMQDDPQYEDVVGDIGLMLQERIEAALAAGVKKDSIIVDPGIGFGKRVEHNLEILRRLREFRCLGQPLLVGASRKAFVKKVVLAEDERRLEGSLAAACAAAMNGANIIRVHDVRETGRALRMIDAIRTA
jgi:dihydropteroate synthase